MYNTQVDGSLWQRNVDEVSTAGNKKHRAAIKIFKDIQQVRPSVNQQPAAVLVQ